MNYHNITYPDMNNGDGLRVVLWLSGCSHYCNGCQNQQTWNPNSGILFDESAKQELFEALSQDYISGITFSGGDPLYEKSLDEVYHLCVEIKDKFPNKTIWIYTGYTLEKLIDEYNIYKWTPFGIGAEEWLMRYEILQYCDVLVDGKYVEGQKDITLKWRGSKNQRVISVQKSLKENKIVLYTN